MADTIPELQGGPGGKREQAAGLPRVLGLVWDVGGNLEAGGVRHQGRAQKDGVWGCHGQDTSPVDRYQFAGEELRETPEEAGRNSVHVEGRVSGSRRAQDKLQDNCRSAPYGVVFYAEGKGVLRQLSVKRKVVAEKAKEATK